MIKKFYYSVWADLILQLQKNPLNKKSWKWYSLFVMSLCFGVNFAFLLSFVPKDLDPTYFFIELHFFDSDFLDTLTHALILFLLPGYLIHYLLVFHKNKYIIIIRKYKPHDGKLFIRYMLISLLTPLIILIIALIICKLT